MELLGFHILGLAISVSVLALADHEAARWFLGKAATLDETTIRRYHAAMWVGLLTMITSGALMAWPAREFLLTNPLFLTKMAFVGILVANAFVIGSLTKVAFTRPYASLSRREKVPLLLSGAASAIGWIGALSVALILFR